MKGIGSYDVEVSIESIASIPEILYSSTVYIRRKSKYTILKETFKTVLELGQSNLELQRALAMVLRSFKLLCL
jgi:hypothetical protein